MNSEDVDTVIALLEDYARARRNGDTDTIAGHWDAQAFVIYKAEEKQPVFHDWEEVLAYWRNNEGLH